MATGSLKNLSVNVDGGNTGLLMPKLKYRFRITFINFGIGGTQELTRQVVDAKRPSVSWTDIPLEVYNSKIHIAGKHEWAEWSCNIRDDAQGNVSKLVGAQLQKQLDFMEQASAASGIDYKFTTRLEILDGGNGAATPNALETWEMEGCYLKSADYGDLNYGTSEASTIALTVLFDNAVQTPLGQGVGMAGVFGKVLGSTATG